MLDTKKYQLFWQLHWITWNHIPLQPCKFEWCRSHALFCWGWGLNILWLITFACLQRKELCAMMGSTCGLRALREHLTITHSKIPAKWVGIFWVVTQVPPGIWINQSSSIYSQETTCQPTVSKLGSSLSFSRVIKPYCPRVFKCWYFYKFGLRLSILCWWFIYINFKAFILM